MDAKNINIVIARGDVLGDVIVTTPLIEGLRTRFPFCKIYYLIRKEYIPVLSDDSRITGFIEDPLPYTLHKEDFSSFFALVKTIKSYKIDLFIGAWEKPRYGLLAFLAGIPLRIGHRSSVWNRILYSKTVAIDYLDFFLHKVEYNLALLKPFGVTTAFPLCLVSAAVGRVEHPYIVVALDAGNPIRILFKEQLALIVKGLLQHTFYNIVLIGRHRNLEAATFILNEVKHDARVINQVDHLSLKEIKDCIAQSSGLIGSDSGPVHIAAGFQKPVVVYYLNRIQNACHWGPWMTSHRIVTSKHDCIDVCSPENCKKTTCREFLAPMNVVSEFVDMMQSVSSESQRHYWIKTSGALALFGSFSNDMMSYLNQEKWRYVELDLRQPLPHLKQTIVEKNINIFVFHPSIPFLSRLKLEVLRRWVSNYISFFPKCVIATTPFELELKLTGHTAEL